MSDLHKQFPTSVFEDESTSKRGALVFDIMLLRFIVLHDQGTYAQSNITLLMG